MPQIVLTNSFIIMSKKKTIIYSVLGAVVVLGLVVSQFVDWPVDEDNASGNIAKSSRFSRKTADGAVGNMQELLQNDEDYKNGIVAACVVMKTRAEQFNALVEMSAEVAGDIKEFEAVLKDMKEAQPMVKNVCASMETVAKDLDAALGGETVEDLEQNSSNAALAYNTLQKQNKLADQFVEAVDNYLKKADANDRLKFVRDQWVDYQQMTATLSQDKLLAEELSKKGYLLSEDKSAAALGSFSQANQLASMSGAALSCTLEVESSLNYAVLKVQANEVLGSRANEEAQGSLNAAAVNALQNSTVEVQSIMNSTVDGMENLQSSFKDAMMGHSSANVLGVVSQVNEVVNSLASAKLGAREEVDDRMGQ